MQSFAKTKIFKVLIIASFLVLLILINPTNFFQPLRSSLLTILVPFQKFSHSMSMGFDETADFFASIGQLKKENQQLLKKTQDLEIDRAKLLDLENENSLLREQIKLLPRDKFDLVAAFVIGHDPNGAGNWIQIDRGRKDGIADGMPVIYSKGVLVGKIKDVEENSARIVLLTNPKSTINVMTSENSSKGILKGEYGLGMIMDMIVQTDSINIGDSVISSGVGGQMPRGLFIGTVQEIHPSEDHLFQQAVITSPIQASKLQAVFVIKKENSSQ